MCSGLACTVGSDPRGRSATLVRHLLYNAGRVSAYCFLGAVIGSLSSSLVLHLTGNPAVIFQRLLALLSGALMIFIGLQLLGYFKNRRVEPGLGGLFFAQALRDLLRTPSPAAPLAFGVFNGFLPCPLVYAFIAQAAASGGSLPGLLIMVAFGLGTFPAMLLAGGLGSRLSFNWRLRGIRIAGLFVIVLGCITLGRGALSLGAHGH